MDDQLVFPKFLKIICVLWLSISLVFGEYTCLCNYSIETPVYSDADESSVPIGFLYEFDCKYLINVLDENRWAVVAFKHQAGYVSTDGQTQVQKCANEALDADIIFSTTTPDATELTVTDALSKTFQTTSVTPEVNTDKTALKTAATLINTSHSTARPLHTTTSSPKFTHATETGHLSSSAEEVTFTQHNETQNSTVTRLSTTTRVFKSSVSKLMTLLTNPTYRTSIEHSETGNPNFTTTKYNAMSSQPNTEPVMNTINVYSTDFKNDVRNVSVLHTTTLHTANYLNFSKTPTEENVVNVTSAPSSTSAVLAGHVDLCPYRFLAESHGNFFQNGKYPLFRQYGEFCYELRLKSGDWNTAFSDCKARSGQLAIVNKEQVKAELGGLVKEMAHQKDSWVGLSYNNSLKTWSWIDGTTPGNLINPQTSVGNCGALSGIDVQIKNRACADQLSWICQYSLM